MDVVVGLVVGLMVGLVIGAVAVAATVRRSRRSRARVTPAGHDGPHILSDEVVEVIRALPGMSIVLDTSDRVERASPRAHALGLIRGSELAHPEILELVRSVRRDGRIQEAELEVARGPLGSGTLTLQIQAATIGDEHVIVLVDDLTYSRRVEQTRRDFVVNVSHELKTPVGGLSLLAEAVEGAADDPDAVRRFAARMHSETSRLTQLVQEIVELSRLQVSAAFEEPVAIDAALCARQALEHVRLLAENKQIDLVCSSGMDAPAPTFGDATLLTTAIRNLLENAIHYSSPHTRVALAVRQAGNLVQVTVTDQGVGISALDQARIFERFYRVDPARSRQTGGTGLGLAIVKHVAQGHGGDVTVWSEEGQGSTFTLHLPLSNERLPQPAIAAASTDPHVAELRESERQSVPGKAVSR